MKFNIPRPLQGGIIIILLLSGGIYLAWEHIQPFLMSAWNFLSDRERMRLFIESYGLMAPLVFMGLQAAQVLLAPIPGEFTGLVGGYVFGWQWALLYSTLALSAGSLLNFGLARWLGRSLLERWAPARTLAKVDGVMKRQGLIT
ncbi:MAG: VTT domain-containing protein, partial [Desulfarculales bacterium]|nr:VTT domain-containing protein [Desulfarculales bacterium]